MHLERKTRKEREIEEKVEREVPEKTKERGNCFEMEGIGGCRR